MSKEDAHPLGQNYSWLKFIELSSVLNDADFVLSSLVILILSSEIVEVTSGRQRTIMGANPTT